MALPLTNLTRADTPWKWTTSCQTAFDDLKEKLSTAPTLHLIDVTDPNAQLEVHTDASGFAIGAVLY